MIMNKTSVGAASRERLPGGVPMGPGAGRYEVRVPSDRAELMQEIEEGRGAFVVIGNVLPARSGAELCRLLEDDDGSLRYPVYLLRSDESDQVERPLDKAVAQALAAGPLHTSLVEHIQQAGQWGEVIRIRGVEIHVKQRDVLLNGVPVNLTTSEFDLLCLMARRLGWALSREEIIAELRGHGEACTPRNVDVLIVGLRRKLGTVGTRIQTVRGVGYRMRA